MAASLVVSAQLASAKEAKPPADAAQKDNPLLQKSTLPYQFPPFDRIKPEHFPPAFDAGMAEHLKEVDAIAQRLG